jgi:hypothetical protein
MRMTRRKSKLEFSFSKRNNFLWIGTDDEGRSLFINEEGTFRINFVDQNGKTNYLFPSLKQIKNYYWILVIMPVNKVKSMLGKLAKNDTTNMRKRLYRHVREAHRNSKNVGNDLF